MAIKDAALEHRLKTWMRPDAYNFIRPDWRRFVKPESDAAALFERYERKYSPDQPRDDHGRWTSEGADAGGDAASQGTTSEPTAGSGQSDYRVLSDATPDNNYKPGAQVAANERQTSESQANPTDDNRRLPEKVAAYCDDMHRKDLFICRAVRLRACYEQAYLRLSNCEVGRPIPNLNF